MPQMLRPKGLATKVAFKILGKPANLTEGNKKVRSSLDRVITYQETQRIK